MLAADPSLSISNPGLCHSAWNQLRGHKCSYGLVGAIAISLLVLGILVTLHAHGVGALANHGEWLNHFGSGGVYILSGLAGFTATILHIFFKSRKRPEIPATAPPVLENLEHETTAATQKVVKPFPPELLAKIFEHLPDPASVQSVRMTCRLLRDVLGEMPYQLSEDGQFLTVRLTSITPMSHCLRRVLLANILRRTCLSLARKVVESVSESPLTKQYTLQDIAIAQMELASFEEAKKTIQMLHWHREEFLQKIAVAQAKAGFFKEARESALTLPDGSWQDTALQQIATEQAKAGSYDAAIETAYFINEKYLSISAIQGVAVAQATAGLSEEALKTARRLQKPTQISIVFKRIAIAQAKAGFFDEALKTIHMPENMYTKSTLLREIAVVCAEAGFHIQAHRFAGFIQTPADRALAMEEVAIAQAKAGFFKEATKTANTSIHDPERRAHILETIEACRRKKQLSAKMSQPEEETSDEASATAVEPLIATAKGEASAGKFGAAKKAINDIRFWLDKVYALRQIASTPTFVSPNSPLGVAITGARPGQTLTISTTDFSIVAPPAEEHSAP